MNMLYDVNAVWDDPFEHLEERRGHPRIKLPFWTELSVRAHATRGKFIGPAIVQDLSLTGARVISKHDDLRPGQTGKIAIPTDAFPLFDLVPPEFKGACHVVRVQPLGGRKTMSALRFSEALINDMDFAHFVRQLETLGDSRRASLAS